VAYLLFAIWMGIGAGVVGRIKGSSFFVWFFIGAVLPVLGLLAAVLYRSERDEPRRACPVCGRSVKLHEQICTRCGTELYFPSGAASRG
jgi:membrane protein implicated in regulation of membrane protease activity